MTEMIVPKDHQHWLTLRSFDVTSTECAALFDASPYLTKFELWHAKKDQSIDTIAENERMKWGKRLEAVIAEGVAQDQGWVIKKFDAYARNSELRLGSSFDYMISDKERGVGILEIKNVDRLVYKNYWNDGLEAPAHIELQVQHQMLVAGYKWCAIVCLIGGNETNIIYRNADPDIQIEIMKKARDFWSSIDFNQPPKADYSQDADYIIRNLRGQANENEFLDATGNVELAELIRQYKFAASERDSMESVVKQYRAQILEHIGAASVVVGEGYKISAGMVKDSVGTLVTPDMVGTYINARKGYRGFRINMKEMVNV